jgi:hypothetical protein
MFPFLVEKNWYENFWYDARSRAKRQTSGARLARFAVCIVLVVGGVVVASHLGSSERSGHSSVGSTGIMIE